MSKTILVTGGCGWLGSEIVRTLLARGDTVVATDIAVPPAMAALSASNPRLSIVPADIGDLDKVAALLRDHPVDAVVHGAAIVGVLQCAEIPIKALRANVEGAIVLFEAMRRNGVKRVVHISTEETYGDFNAPMIDEDHPQRPTSVYGLTKLAAEHYGRVYARNYGLECIHVRTCWVYGPHLPRLRMPRTFIEAALRGEPYHMPEGRDFPVDQVYIADTVQGVLLALDKRDHRFDAYNIATGAAPTLGETAEAVNRAIPGARISVGASATFTLDGMIVSATKGALDISRARGELGYSPQFDIKRGIEATIEATRKQFGKAEQGAA